MIHAPIGFRLSIILFVLTWATRNRPCLSLSLVGKLEHKAKSAFESNTLQSRRSVLALLPTLPVIASATPCLAEEQSLESSTPPPSDGRSRGGKPFAPLEALLPAARLKLVVDRMYDLSTSLKTTNDKENQFQILVRMNQIWTTRPPLFPKNAKLPPRSVTGSSAQLTTGISSANKQQYQDLRKDLSIPDRMAAMLNQADVERQWGMLQYEESKREQGNEFRAALNFYTSQLKFGNAYVLTASEQDRKRLIRNDELPTLTAVITSDLDLRDLYRNDFLTALEDVNAEIEYQLKQPHSEVDVTDVVDLMTTAHTAITKWFALIADTDVREAMEVVEKE